MNFRGSQFFDIFFRQSKSTESYIDYWLLLDAFNGLILAFAFLGSAVIWEARLQFPFFHFIEGSGQAVQYQPDDSSALRLQPSHFSMTSWQIPFLYEQPFAVIKRHSTPSLIVEQIK